MGDLPILLQTVVTEAPSEEIQPLASLAKIIGYKESCEVHVLLC